MYLKIMFPCFVNQKSYYNYTTDTNFCGDEFFGTDKK